VACLELAAGSLGGLFLRGSNCLGWFLNANAIVGDGMIEEQCERLQGSIAFTPHFRPDMQGIIPLPRHSSEYPSPCNLCHKDLPIYGNCNS
jgi:hypothetical protein